ncbi:hypothetical protein SKAU_G00054460 [Synaphobranchus kaupii]|uniref:Uncharacterized protein n=1 Tax=Synaphobranchus kaupii TaxID=118154 RepID=A0A9Q1J8Y9_SYNKA|nr:hypothetical protein SKAU_G00054460 [Synaphobranchus kaupii]
MPLTLPTRKISPVCHMRKWAREASTIATCAHPFVPFLDITSLRLLSLEEFVVQVSPKTPDSRDSLLNCPASHKGAKLCAAREDSVRGRAERVSDRAVRTEGRGGAVLRRARAIRRAFKEERIWAWHIS